MNCNSHDHKSIGWRKRLLNSRFFTISCILHLMIVVLLGGTVLFHKYVEPEELTGGEVGTFLQPTETELLPNPEAQPAVDPAFKVATTPTQTISFDVILANPRAETAFNMEQVFSPQKPIEPKMGGEANGVDAPTGPLTQKMDARQIAEIAEYTNWEPKGPAGYGTSPRKRDFQFNAYLAKYSGGDWASTVRLEKGRIVGGSLPNLLYVMQNFSNDKIKAQHQAEPLDLSSDVIFSERTPFIFFTGHRDFTLTPKEVENLQKYIRLGGCIWGDSSLPGQRSRFDIAFRREMRRVMGEGNEDFQRLPSSHPLFTKNLYYPEIRGIPSGLNHYQEPVYAMMHLGQIAVLYTANDYGDMWQFGLNDAWKFETGRTESGSYVAMNPTFWERRDSYFRNTHEDAVKAAYQFGTNVVFHLLTRWEDLTRHAPKSL